MKKKANFLLRVLYSYIIYLLVFMALAACMALGFIDIIDSYIFLFIGVWLIWLVFFLIAAVRNLIQALIIFREKKTDELVVLMKHLKYKVIPFFILNFLLGGILFLAFMAVSHGMGIFFIPVPIMFTWICLLSTSVYGIAYLVIEKRNGRIVGRKFTWHMVMHFCFILDIISTWLLTKNNTTGK